MDKICIELKFDEDFNVQISDVDDGRVLAEYSNSQLENLIKDNKILESYAEEIQNLQYVKKSIDLICDYLDAVMSGGIREIPITDDYLECLIRDAFNDISGKDHFNRMDKKSEVFKLLMDELRERDQYNALHIVDYVGSSYFIDGMFQFLPDFFDSYRYKHSEKRGPSHEWETWQWIKYNIDSMQLDQIIDGANIPSSGRAQGQFREACRALQYILYRKFNDGDEAQFFWDPNFYSVANLMDELTRMSKDDRHLFHDIISNSVSKKIVNHDGKAHMPYHGGPSYRYDGNINPDTIFSCECPIMSSVIALRALFEMIIIKGGDEFEKYKDHTDNLTDEEISEIMTLIREGNCFFMESTGDWRRECSSEFDIWTRRDYRGW